MLYWIVKQSISETDQVQCKQEKVLRCLESIISFKNGANETCSVAGIIRKDTFLVRTFCSPLPP